MEHSQEIYVDTDHCFIDAKTKSGRLCFLISLVLPSSAYDSICYFLLVRNLYLCFRWSGRNHREKIGVHVVFDQVLNMEPYCCRDMLSSLDKETFAYDLSAVVMHHGKGFGSGHYTAYCYNTEGGACALLCGVGDTEEGWFVHIPSLPFYFIFRGILHTLKSSGKNYKSWIQILDISPSDNIRLP